jgi:hypothetical protein
MRASPNAEKSKNVKKVKTLITQYMRFAGKVKGLTIKVF